MPDLGVQEHPPRPLFWSLQATLLLTPEITLRPAVQFLGCFLGCSVCFPPPIQRIGWARGEAKALQNETLFSAMSVRDVILIIQHQRAETQDNLSTFIRCAKGMFAKGILEGTGFSLFRWESAPELPSHTGQCQLSAGLPVGGGLYSANAI